MPADRSSRRLSPAGILALVASSGLVLGVGAQLLRQMAGPPMSLGAATAPWLTIGFLLAILATRQKTSSWRAPALATGTIAAYLIAWIVSYHTLFAIRESVGQADAWREAAPWLLLAAPASLLLGGAAAFSHRRGVIGDVCVALPIVWSMPEMRISVDHGWAYAGVVAFPIAALAVFPIVVIERRDVSLVRLVLVGTLFAVMGLAFVPIMREAIHFVTGQ